VGLCRLLRGLSGLLRGHLQNRQQLVPHIRRGVEDRLFRFLRQPQIGRRQVALHGLQNLREGPRGRQRLRLVHGKGAGRVLLPAAAQQRHRRQGGKSASYHPASPPKSTVGRSSGGEPEENSSQVTVWVFRY